MTKNRESIHGVWSSQWAFILAAAGAAVGLGNIWKFPYIAGENGGGAFVLIYLVCITLLGYPIMTSEIILGRQGRQNPMNSIATLAEEAGQSRLWGIIGFSTVLAGFLILSYYSVIAGWALDYVFQAAAGHFNGLGPTQINALFDDLMANPWLLLAWHSLTVLATTLVVGAGVQKGIERAVIYLFPAMVALLVIIALYSVKTGYFGHGLEFLFKPDFSQIQGKSILIALGHAFFTLSIATGSIIMYGAYLPDDTSIPRASFFIVLADTLIALLAGLAIFPIVFANGLEPGAGPGLIFKTLPIAFGKMPYGHFFSVIFFVMLVFAAYTSAISLLEPSVAWTMENFGLHRKQAAIIIGFFIWLIGLGTVFSFNLWSEFKIFGRTFFDALDHLTANIMLPLTALGIAIFAAWRLPRAITQASLGLGKSAAVKAWQILLGIIGPIMIVMVFLQAVGLIQI